MFELTPFVRHAMAYDPFRDFDEMEKRLFKGSTAFRTDIKDTGDAYVIEAELPGFNKEDIEITVENSVMTVSASHTQSKEEQDEKSGYVRRERSYGSFARSFDVSEIETDNITGSLQNGILSLTLPKKKEQAAASRKIELA